VNKQPFEIKAYTPKELRGEYGVSDKTFASWLSKFRDKVGEVKGKTYTPAQVQIIVEHLGEP
jgi:hypothetical protein